MSIPAERLTIFKEASVLVVDDEALNLDVINELLEEVECKNIDLYSNPVKALEAYATNRYDLILLDVMMPVMDGFAVLGKMKLLNRTSAPPVIIMTAFSDKAIRLKALSMGARDFISKPFDMDEVLVRAANLIEMHMTQLTLMDYSNDLEQRVQDRTQALQQSQLDMIERLGLAAEYRDTDTGKHTIRVGLYAEKLGQLLHLPESECELLRLAAPMHDIGKIGIPDTILLKPGRLDEEELRIMHTHSNIGGRILGGSSSEILRYAGVIALTHHENWDGSGYPDGLSGDAIPLCGRITSLADVFDALLAVRPYKKPWTVQQVQEFITANAATKFDPQLTSLFLDNFDIFYQMYLDNQE